MNLRQQKRLLNVAKALRDGDPRNFSMDRFGWDEDNYMGHPCGTPACALGHYAARTDLQKRCKLTKDERVIDLHNRNNDPWEMAEEHFGITAEETDLLFASDGCNLASTNKQAAKYIERFVARKAKENK